MQFYTSYSSDLVVDRLGRLICHIIIVFYWSRGHSLPGMSLHSIYGPSISMIYEPLSNFDFYLLLIIKSSWLYQKQDIRKKLWKLRIEIFNQVKVGREVAFLPLTGWDISMRFFNLLSFTT